jgi:hypothetical protein
VLVSPVRWSRAEICRARAVDCLDEGDGVDAEGDEVA